MGQENGVSPEEIQRFLDADTFRSPGQPDLRIEGGNAPEVPHTTATGERIPGQAGGTEATRGAQRWLAEHPDAVRERVGTAGSRLSGHADRDLGDLVDPKTGERLSASLIRSGAMAPSGGDNLQRQIAASQHLLSLNAPHLDLTTLTPAERQTKLEIETAFQAERVTALDLLEQQVEADREKMHNMFRYRGEFDKGFDYGWNGMTQSLHGLGMLISDALDDREGVDESRRKLEHAQLVGQVLGTQRVTSPLEIKSANDAIDWLVGGTGQVLANNIPGLALAIPTGGASAVAARVAAERALAGAVEKRLAASGILGPAVGAESVAAARISAMASPEFATTVNRLNAWKNVGVGAGAFAGSAPLEAGESYNELTERGIDDPAATAAVVGIAAGSLDAMSLTTIIGKLFPGMKASEAASTVAALSTPEVRSFAGRAASKLAVNPVTKGAALGMAVEGPTEVLQELIHMGAIAAHDPTFSMSGPEANKRLIDAFSLGVLGGAVLGGGTSAVHSTFSSLGGKLQKRADERARRAETAANALGESPTTEAFHVEESDAVRALRVRENELSNALDEVSQRAAQATTDEERQQLQQEAARLSTELSRAHQRVNEQHALDTLNARSEQQNSNLPPPPPRITGESEAEYNKRVAEFNARYREQYATGTDTAAEADTPEAIGTPDAKVGVFPAPAFARDDARASSGVTIDGNTWKDALRAAMVHAVSEAAKGSKPPSEAFKRSLEKINNLLADDSDAAEANIAAYVREKLGQRDASGMSFKTIPVVAAEIYDRVNGKEARVKQDEEVAAKVQAAVAEQEANIATLREQKTARAEREKEPFVAWLQQFKQGRAAKIASNRGKAPAERESFDPMEIRAGFIADLVTNVMHLSPQELLRVADAKIRTKRAAIAKARNAGYPLASEDVIQEEIDALIGLKNGDRTIAENMIAQARDQFEARTRGTEAAEAAQTRNKQERDRLEATQNAAQDNTAEESTRRQVQGAKEDQPETKPGAKDDNEARNVDTEDTRDQATVERQAARNERVLSHVHSGSNLLRHLAQNAERAEDRSLAKHLIDIFDARGWPLLVTSLSPQITDAVRKVISMITRGQYRDQVAGHESGAVLLRTRSDNAADSRARVGTDDETILHEYLHAALARIIADPRTPTERAAVARLRALVDGLKSQKRPEAIPQTVWDYMLGKHAVDETVSFTLTSPEIRAALDTLVTGARGHVRIWQAIKDVFIKLLGLKRDTYGSEIEKAARQLLDSPRAYGLLPTLREQRATRMGAGPQRKTLADGKEQALSRARQALKAAGLPESTPLRVFPVVNGNVLRTIGREANRLVAAAKMNPKTTVVFKAEAADRNLRAVRALAAVSSDPLSIDDLEAHMQAETLNRAPILEQIKVREELTAALTSGVLGNLVEEPMAQENDTADDGSDGEIDNTAEADTEVVERPVDADVNEAYHTDAEKVKRRYEAFRRFAATILRGGDINFIRNPQAVRQFIFVRSPVWRKNADGVWVTTKAGTTNFYLEADAIRRLGRELRAIDNNLSKGSENDKRADIEDFMSGLFFLTGEAGLVATRQAEKGDEAIFPHLTNDGRYLDANNKYREQDGTPSDVPMLLEVTHTTARDGAVTQRIMPFKMADILDTNALVRELVGHETGVSDITGLVINKNSRSTVADVEETARAKNRGQLHVPNSVLFDGGERWINLRKRIDDAVEFFSSKFSEIKPSRTWLQLMSAGREYQAALERWKNVDELARKFESASTRLRDRFISEARTMPADQRFGRTDEQIARSLFREYMVDRINRSLRDKRSAVLFALDAYSPDTKADVAFQDNMRSAVLAVDRLIAEHDQLAARTTKEILEKNGLSANEGSVASRRNWVLRAIEQKLNELGQDDRQPPAARAKETTEKFSLVTLEAALERSGAHTITDAEEARAEGIIPRGDAVDENSPLGIEHLERPTGIEFNEKNMDGTARTVSDRAPTPIPQGMLTGEVFMPVRRFLSGIKKYPIAEAAVRLADTVLNLVAPNVHVAIGTFEDLEQQRGDLATALRGELEDAQAELARAEKTGVDVAKHKGKVERLEKALVEDAYFTAKTRDKAGVVFFSAARNHLGIYVDAKNSSSSMSLALVMAHEIGHALFRLVIEPSILSGVLPTRNGTINTKEMEYQYQEHLNNAEPSINLDAKSKSVLDYITGLRRTAPTENAIREQRVLVDGLIEKVAKANRALSAVRDADRPAKVIRIAEDRARAARGAYNEAAAKLKGLETRRSSVKGKIERGLRALDALVMGPKAISSRAQFFESHYRLPGTTARMLAAYIESNSTENVDEWAANQFIAFMRGAKLAASGVLEQLNKQAVAKARATRARLLNGETVEDIRESNPTDAELGIWHVMRDLALDLYAAAKSVMEKLGFSEATRLNRAAEEFFARVVTRNSGLEYVSPGMNAPLAFSQDGFMSSMPTKLTNFGPMYITSEEARTQLRGDAGSMVSRLSAAMRASQRISNGLDRVGPMIRDAFVTAEEVFSKVLRWNTGYILSRENLTPELRAIAEIFDSHQFYNTWHSMRTRYSSRVHEITKSLTAEETEETFNYLFSRQTPQRNSVSTAAVAAGEAIRAVQKDLYVDVATAFNKAGGAAYVAEHFQQDRLYGLPRVWDREAILADVPGFIEMMQRPENGIEFAAIQEFIDKIRGGGDMDITTLEDLGTAPGTASSAKSRNFPAYLVGSERFVQRDLNATLRTYYDAMAKTTAVATYFGGRRRNAPANMNVSVVWTPTGKINHAIYKALDDTPVPMEGNRAVAAPRMKREDVMYIANKAIPALLGRLGQDVSPQLRRFNARTAAVLNALLLPFSTLSSLPDFAGMYIRSQDAQMVSQAFSSFLQSQSRADIKKMSEFLGITTSAELDSYLAESFNEAAKGDEWATKINHKLFEYNQQQRYTKFTRTLATELARIWLREKLEVARANPADTELGRQVRDELSEVVPYMTSSGRTDMAAKKYSMEEFLAILDNAARHDFNPITVHEAARAAFAAGPTHLLDYSRAFNDTMSVFINQTILNPNASDRPVWASDPRWMLVFHLKQFAYSFHKVILGRMYSNFAKAYASGGILAMAARATMDAAPLLALAAAGLILRNFFQYTLFGDEPPEDRQFGNGYGYLWQVTQRSGVLGLFQFAADVQREVDQGGFAPVAVLGPFATKANDMLASFTKDEDKWAEGTSGELLKLTPLAWSAPARMQFGAMLDQHSP